MIDSYYADYFLMPVNDFWVSTKYSASHTGIDLGWHATAACSIYPIQEGKVVDKFFSSSCGYTCVVQHDYSDGTHRFSAYLHMRNACTLAVGTLVYPMTYTNKTALGIRGTTGQSSGVHLHLYVTAKTTKSYNWNLIGHSYSQQICNFDPLPHLYVSKNITYSLASDDKITNYPYYEDIPAPVTYPTPVERNTKVKQVNVLIDYLYLRNAPSGTAYSKYCTKGIYNIAKEQNSGNYCWYLIDTIDNKEFWIASGGTRTEDLLAEASAEEVLQTKLDEANKTIASLQTQLANAEKLNTEYQATTNTLTIKIANALKDLS